MKAFGMLVYRAALVGGLVLLCGGVGEVARALFSIAKALNGGYLP